MRQNADQSLTDSKPGEETQKYSMHSFGAVFTEVRIDQDLGIIRVPRIVGAYGVGKGSTQVVPASWVINDTQDPPSDWFKGTIPASQMVCKCVTKLPFARRTSARS